MDNKVPDNYFSKLTDKVMQQVGKEELDTLGPELTRMSKKEPYLIPDDYFEHNVERICAAAKSSLPVRSYDRRTKTIFLRRWAAVAAVIMVGIFVHGNMDESTIPADMVVHTETDGMPNDKLLSELSYSETDIDIMYTSFMDDDGYWDDYELSDDWIMEEDIDDEDITPMLDHIVAEMSDYDMLMVM